MFSSNVIEKRVLSVIKKKIADKQKEYDEGCKMLADQALAQIEAVQREHEAKKMELTDNCVNDIIGKII